MPKLGMEPIRRAALVKATIDEVGLAGSLEVTVSQIAKRAGVSSGLAHHYFGGKEQIFLAAMRHILSVYGAQVRVALSIATTPTERLEGIILASFEASNFRSEVVGSWLNFYVLAHRSVGAKRLLSIYQRRLRSNLIHDLRPLIPASQLENSAQGIAALIDGLYIRRSLGAQNTSDPISITKIYLASILNQKEVK
ncbi:MULTISPECIES: transcriptional regulator BetI [Falsihalocynthiibacter]|uniref:transcriptional regulator BetI n=1 Tax=Falsihalocynthiibacter TaxID=2854182 RepID=UPI00300396E9